MKLVQIGAYDYINVDAIVYVDGKNRIIRTNEAGRNMYKLEEKWFNDLIKEIL